MLHPVGGNRPLAGKALEPGLPGLFLLDRLLVPVGLDAGHSTRPSGLGLSFQRLNPPLQLVNHRLLAGNERQQGFPWRAGEVKAGIHVSDLT